MVNTADSQNICFLIPLPGVLLDLLRARDGNQVAAFAGQGTTKRCTIAMDVQRKVHQLRRTCEGWRTGEQSLQYLRHRSNVPGLRQDLVQ